MDRDPRTNPVNPTVLAWRVPSVRQRCAAEPPFGTVRWPALDGHNRSSRQPENRVASDRFAGLSGRSLTSVRGDEIPKPVDEDLEIPAGIKDAPNVRSSRRRMLAADPLLSVDLGDSRRSSHGAGCVRTVRFRAPRMSTGESVLAHQRTSSSHWPTSWPRSLAGTRAVSRAACGWEEACLRACRQPRVTEG